VEKSQVDHQIGKMSRGEVQAGNINLEAMTFCMLSFMAEVI
jgi:hypothetical protein